VTLFHSLGIVAYSGVSAAAPGMVLMNPTSIAYSGTSATLGANGQVTFSAVTSLSLNGCFTADFDNYVMAVCAEATSGNDIFFRLRTSGSDATGSNYVRQVLQANSTTITAFRESSQAYATLVNFGDSGSENGGQVFFYGPYLSQPTAFRSVTVRNTPILFDVAATHSLSTSYDGFTFYAQNPAVNFTGACAVYGIRS
jgi:hypothetical protein